MSSIAGTCGRKVDEIEHILSSQIWFIRIHMSVYQHSEPGGFFLNSIKATPSAWKADMRADANLQVNLSDIVHQTKGRIEKVICRKREKKLNASPHLSQLKSV